MGTWRGGEAGWARGSRTNVDMYELNKRAGERESENKWERLESGSERVR